MGLPTLPKIYNVYFLAIIATMGGMLFGFDISSMSAIIGTDQYLYVFCTAQHAINMQLTRTKATTSTTHLVLSKVRLVLLSLQAQ